MIVLNVLVAVFRELNVHLFSYTFPPFLSTIVNKDYSDSPESSVVFRELNVHLLNIPHFFFFAPFCP